MAWRSQSIYHHLSTPWRKQLTVVSPRGPRSTYLQSGAHPSIVVLSTWPRKSQLNLEHQPIGAGWSQLFFGGNLAQLGRMGHVTSRNPLCRINNNVKSMWWIHMNPVLTCIKHCLSCCILMTMFFWEKIDAKKPWELPFWGIQHVQMLDLRHQKGSPATKAVFRLRSFSAIFSGRSHVAMDEIWNCFLDLPWDLPNKNGDFHGICLREFVSSPSKDGWDMLGQIPGRSRRIFRAELTKGNHSGTGDVWCYFWMILMVLKWYF